MSNDGVRIGTACVLTAIVLGGGGVLKYSDILDVPEIDLEEAVVLMVGAATLFCSGYLPYRAVRNTFEAINTNNGQAKKHPEPSSKSHSLWAAFQAVGTIVTCSLLWYAYTSLPTPNGNESRQTQSPPSKPLPKANNG